MPHLATDLIKLNNLQLAGKLVSEEMWLGIHGRSGDWGVVEGSECLKSFALTVLARFIVSHKKEKSHDYNSSTSAR